MVYSKNYSSLWRKSDSRHLWKKKKISTRFGNSLVLCNLNLVSAKIRFFDQEAIFSAFSKKNILGWSLVLLSCLFCAICFDFSTIFPCFIIFSIRKLNIFTKPNRHTHFRALPNDKYISATRYKWAPLVCLALFA